MLQSQAIETTDDAVMNLNGKKYLQKGSISSRKKPSSVAELLNNKMKITPKLDIFGIARKPLLISAQPKWTNCLFLETMQLVAV